MGETPMPREEPANEKRGLAALRKLDIPTTPGDNACVEAVNRDCGENLYAAFRHEHRQTMRA